MKDGEALPKTLPGAVCRQWVRCGKPNCRCAQGELHGPYWYRFWREGGCLHKKYVRPEDLDAVRAACEARRHQRRQVLTAWEEFRAIKRLLRRLEHGG